MNTLFIAKEFVFDAAHKLPDYDGLCKNLHGHRWRLLVEVEGIINPDSGMVLDFKELKKIVNENVIDILDHSYLNDLIDNPTAENIIYWINNELFEVLNAGTYRLNMLRLYEAPDSYVELV